MPALRATATMRSVTELAAPTARKRQILDLVADGCATKEIASRLGISTAAVDKHLRQLFRRYKVPNRAALVCAAFRHAHLLALGVLVDATQVLDWMGDALDPA